MKLNDDWQPATLEEAVDYICNNISEEEKAVICDPKAASGMVHFGLGMRLRNDWNLWQPDLPMKYDIAKRYGIAHADDISGLLWEWVWHKVRGEEFDPVAHCQRYHAHWPRYGTTALEAGGWKEDASGPNEQCMKAWYDR